MPKSGWYCVVWNRWFGWAKSLWIPDSSNNIQEIMLYCDNIVPFLSGCSESTRNRVHLDRWRVAVLLTRQRESGPEEKLEAAVRRDDRRRQISKAWHYRGDEGDNSWHKKKRIISFIHKSHKSHPSFLANAFFAGPHSLLAGQTGKSGQHLQLPAAEQRLGGRFRWRRV